MLTHGKISSISETKYFYRRFIVLNINLTFTVLRLLMLTLAGFIFCLLPNAPLKAQVTDENPEKNASLKELVNQNYNHLESTYKQLHSSPELSFQEKETSSFIARELKRLGYEVTTNIGGYGVVGILKNGSGPVIMVRTDMDALPIKELTGLPYQSKKTSTDEAGNEVPIMHACGHDIHMTVFLGVGKLMSELKDGWSGTLMMVAEPAEEHGEGAKSMLKDGLYTKFQRPDYALAFHVQPSLQAGYVGYTKGYASATVDSVDITMRGIGGHGAYPQDAIDPVVMASELVLSLQTIASREIKASDPVVVTVGQIHGGTKRNIIPNEVNLELTVRTYDNETRKKVLDSIERRAKGIAAAYVVPEGLEPVVKFKEDPTPAVYNSPGLVDMVIPGIQTVLGHDKVVAVEPVMGGEDFSRFGLEDPKTPIFMMRLGISSEEQLSGAKTTPTLHSSYLAPVPEPSIKTGILTMTASLLELFNQDIQNKN